VSENDNYHCITAQALQKSSERTPEEESLEATSENRRKGCRRDMLAQTVPSTVSSNREGPIYIYTIWRPRK